MTQLNPGPPPAGGGARKLHATRLGLLVLLPAYAIVAALALTFIIALFPLTTYLQGVMLLESQMALAESVVIILFGALALTAFIATLPGAIALWLGVLATLRIICRGAPADILHIRKTLNWIIVLVLFSTPLSVAVALAARFWLGDISAIVLYGVAMLFCNLLCIALLRTFPQHLGDHVRQPAKQLKRSPRPPLQILVIVAAVLASGSAISYLTFIYHLQNAVIFHLRYIYALPVLVFIAVTVGWRAPLSLRRQQNGLALFTMAVFIAVFIGISIFAAVTAITADSLLSSWLSRTQANLFEFIFTFYWIFLSLLPMLLLLLPLTLMVSARYARLRRERDAADVA